MAFHFPPPAEWRTFQTLVAGFARSLYDAHTVEEYGRNGQRQNGVDVFAKDLFGKNVGLQCKWVSESLAESALTAECDKAEKFDPSLDYYLLWTTAQRDVHIQDIAHRINESGRYRFQVSVRFWDDAINHLNSTYQVANDYYNDWLEQHQLTADHDHRKKLRIAFDRPAFNDPIHFERNFQDLLAAVKDTIIFLKTGLLYDRYNRALVAQALPLSMLSDAAYVQGLSKLLLNLTMLEELLQRDTFSNSAPVLTDPEDVAACDRLRQSIARQVSRLRR